MNADNLVGVIWSVGALVVVGSALAARRLSAARLGMMAVAWVTIFIVAVTLVIVLQMMTHRRPRIEVTPTARDQLTTLHNVYYQTDAVA